jgi:DNA gyrase/topoisomerase IV subunit B
MTDADVDGAHICSLLLTFFYRFMPQLIKNGHLFIAQPPLYRIDAGKKLFYAIDEKDKDKIVKELNGAKYEVGRFKGLGEMPSQDLKSTTMDKNKRTLIQVTIENNKRTDKAFGRLMGKEAQHRFKFIQEKAPFFKELDV